LGIKPEEGKKVFDQILRCHLPQVIVSPEDLFRFFNRNGGEADTEKTAGGNGADIEIDYHPRPELSSDYVVPGNPIEEDIAKIWQELLKIDQVGVHDNFFELGGHSLLATRLLARLQGAFPTDFSMTDIFERPTVFSLAAKIMTGKNTEETLVESKGRGQMRKDKRIQRIRPSRRNTNRGEAANA
jgi:acyl carrier protein